MKTQIVRLVLFFGMLFLHQVVFSIANDTVFGKYQNPDDFFENADWNTILLDGKEWESNQPLVLLNYTSRKNYGSYAMSFYISYSNDSIEQNEEHHGYISLRVNINSDDTANFKPSYPGSYTKVYPPAGTFKFETLTESNNYIRHIKIRLSKKTLGDSISLSNSDFKHAEIRIINNYNVYTGILIYLLFDNGEHMLGKVIAETLPDTIEDPSYFLKKILRLLPPLFVIYMVISRFLRKSRSKDKMEEEFRFPLMNNRNWEFHFSETSISYFNQTNVYGGVEEISFVIDKLKQKNNLQLAISELELPDLRIIEFHNISRMKKNSVPWVPPYQHELFKTPKLEEVSFNQVSPYFIEVYFNRIYNPSSLKKISISNCGLPEIPKRIFEFQNLEVLIINDEKNLDEFPEEIYQLTSLKELIISKVPGYKFSIDDRIASLKDLEVLKLNYLTIDDVSTLLYKLPKLKTVNLYNSSFIPTKDYETFKRNKEV